MNNKKLFSIVCFCFASLAILNFPLPAKAEFELHNATTDTDVVFFAYYVDQKISLEPGDTIKQIEYVAPNNKTVFPSLDTGNVLIVYRLFVNQKINGVCSLLFKDNKPNSKLSECDPPYQLVTSGNQGNTIFTIVKK